MPPRVVISDGVYIFFDEKNTPMIFEKHHLWGHFSRIISFLGGNWDLSYFHHITQMTFSFQGWSAPSQVKSSKLSSKISQPAGNKGWGYAKSNEPHFTKTYKNILGLTDTKFRSKHSAKPKCHFSNRRIAPLWACVTMVEYWCIKHNWATLLTKKNNSLDIWVSYINSQLGT